MTTLTDNADFATTCSFLAINDGVDGFFAANSSILDITSCGGSLGQLRIITKTL